MQEHISISENAKHSAERCTSHVLRLGVWASASLMILGLLIATIWPSSVITITSNPSLGDLIVRIFSGTFDPVTLMFAGIVLLMFTPILRVITAVFAFAIEKDRRFVFVSSIVLIMLAVEIIYSIFLKG